MFSLDTQSFPLPLHAVVEWIEERIDVVRGVLAACEEGEEGVWSGRRASRRYAPLKGGLPLLGDGDAVVEEAERLMALEGGEVDLDHWMVSKVVGWGVGEVGLVEPQVLEVGEVGEGGGDNAGDRVAG